MGAPGGSGRIGDRRAPVAGGSTVSLTAGPPTRGRPGARKHLLGALATCALAVLPPAGWAVAGVDGPAARVAVDGLAPGAGVDGLAPGAGVDPERARREAEDIVSRPPFRAEPPGFLQRLVRRVTDPLRRLLVVLSRATGAGVGAIPRPVLVALAVVVVLCFAAMATRLARRTGSPGRAPGGRLGPGSGPAPEELERLAGRAEAEGRLEEALRLRFRAGVARLERDGRLPARPLTNASIARIVGSERFVALAGTFEEVVFGRRPATGEDVASARREWPRVLEEVGPR